MKLKGDDLINDHNEIGGTPASQAQPQSPAELWTTVLGQLQQQMTQATFDSWVKDTYLIAANNGAWQIGVKSEFAKDWLENRLLTTIQRTVANLVGRRVELDFVVDTPELALDPMIEVVETEPAISLQQEKTQPDEAFEVTFARDTDFYTPKKEIGRWLPEWQYDNLFWSPYLGKAYAFYRHLLMAWTKNVRKSDFNRLDLSNPTNLCAARGLFRLIDRRFSWFANLAFLLPGGVVWRGIERKYTG